MTQGKKIPSEEIAKHLKETGGNISATARRMDVNKQTIYDRVSAEPELRTITEQERQGMVDIAEHGLKELMFSDNQAVRLGAIKYALSTIGKSRGYTERQEVDVSGMTVIVRQRDAKL